MDIGTAKPSPADRAAVRHHLLDLVDPSEAWSVARWAAAARDAVASIEARGRRALLVGGTGLYFQALVDGLQPPGQYPQVRGDLEQNPDTASLHSRLEQLDPVAAGRMEPSNRRRVIRALEVTIGSGRTFSSFGPGMTAFPQTAWKIAGVWLPRRTVAARVDDRFDNMISRGLVEEVRRLAGSGALSRTARQALGYREILAHVEDGTDLDVAIAEAKRRTKAFARRQRVWWRRDPRIAWFGTTDNPFAVIAPLLGQWSKR
jgi:tRNA dimethylallyltransferase